MQECRIWRNQSFGRQRLERAAVTALLERKGCLFFRARRPSGSGRRRDAPIVVRICASWCDRELRFRCWAARGIGIDGALRDYNRDMSLPVYAALVVKLLWWLLALIIFLKLYARHTPFVDADPRRMVAAMVLGALLGSKLVYALTYPGLFLDSEAIVADRVLAWLSGDSMPGALLGGRFGLWLADRRGGGGRQADRLVTPVAAALLVLAVGTFFWALRGTGYGSPTTVLPGIDFGDGVKRHPVMLYEAVYLGLVVWFSRTMVTGDAGAGAGAKSQGFLAGYCVLTVLLGYLKPPFHAPLLLEAIVQQPVAYASLVTGEQFACIGAALLFLSRWRPAIFSAQPRA